MNGIIQIYEGNKSGIGKQTKRGYQRNERAKDYIDALEALEFTVVRKGNILYLK